MLILAIIMFIGCPLASLPFVYAGIKKDKKHTNLYLLIIAAFLALFSYIYRPNYSEDLYRHHEYTMEYQYMDMDGLMNELVNEPEQLSIIYKYLISKTGNYDLLQFFTSTICFFIIFYLLNQYTKKNKDCGIWKQIAVWLFVISGFHFIVITSGIFYTLALEIFSLGVYMDYERGRKKTSLLLYIIPSFIHTCAVLPTILLILYKLLKSKITLKNVMMMVVLIVSIEYLLTMISSSIKLPIISELSNLHDAYFNNEEQLARLHTPLVLGVYLSRLIPIVAFYKIANIKKGIGGFSIFMAAAVIALYFQTSFSIRYIHIVILCGIPILFKTINNKKYGQVFCILLYGLALLHFAFQVYQLSGLGYFDFGERAFTTNLIMSFMKG